jgi:hypothetical protein
VQIFHDDHCGLSEARKPGDTIDNFRRTDQRRLANYLPYFAIAGFFPAVTAVREALDLAREFWKTARP